MMYYGLSIIIKLIGKHIIKYDLWIVQKYILSLIITSFIMMNFVTYLSFQKDWFKQLSLVENFKTNEIIKDGASFVFVDNAKNMNAINRNYRFYEYNGLFKLAFNDEKRFGIDENEFNDINNFKYCINYPVYNMSDFRLKNPEERVIINQGEYIPSSFYTIRLLYFQRLKNPEFTKIIKSILDIKTQKRDANIYEP
jgi:hypothetical protein